MTWKNDRQRHALSARGIKSTTANDIKEALKNDNINLKMKSLIGKQAIMWDDNKVGYLIVTIEGIGDVGNGTFDVETECGERVDNVSIFSLDFETPISHAYTGGYTHGQLREFVKGLFPIKMPGTGLTKHEARAEQVFQALNMMDEDGGFKWENIPEWLSIEIEKYT